MSIRGSLVLECDSKDCHAELVLDTTDADIERRRAGVQVEFYAGYWVLDDGGWLHCPQCTEQHERDEVYERAAARARENNFADTKGKDWT